MNPSTALARVLVDELARCGLAEAVIAPGSRSTPLALALLAHPGIRAHVRLDERSAGFLALGLARGSRRGVALVCTSGTAAANFHPAVLEADQSEIPLLVLTADRPPELRATGANQTTDQIRLYGSAVRWFVEVGTPEPVAGMRAYWRSLGCRAWQAAEGPPAGPVHLNLAFRDPLVPDGREELAGASWPEPLEGRAEGRPWITRTRRVEEPPAVELPAVERGVIVCGDGDYDPTPYLGLAAATGWPLLAEPTSNARRGEAVSTYRQLLEIPEFVAAHRPELVVSVGRPGLSRRLLSYLRTARRHVVVGESGRFADPVRTATDVVTAVAAPRDADPGTDWARSWQWAEERARERVDAFLDGEEELGELRLARDLVRTVPNGSLLFAGSSMPIRDLDATMPARCGVRVVGNRGVSGIDGAVSTAVGGALAHRAAEGGGTYALVGDLSLLHDQNGLIMGPEEPVPDLTIVVANNDGGGIFAGLEQAGHPDFERLFGTPHGVTAERVAATAGLPYSRVVRAGDLPGALLAGGPRVVELRADRSASAAARRHMREAVARAVC